KIDLSDPDEKFDQCQINKDDNVIIAMPSFGGRAVKVAIDRLGKINGNNARCTIVCVYGNRAYEDTLVEMQDAATQSNFIVTSAIAAVAKYSIINQYAANRPDESDKKQLGEFADKIKDKKDAVSFVPGSRPYKKSGGASLVPKPDKNCIKCDICVNSCPVKAINTTDLKADPSKCIGCMRCVAICPHEARVVNKAMVSVAALAIKKACSQRKDNELFI
ncbi:MAG: 4Fe-4S binding protein, partial [Firmicutes bacterium]|nr:4Fe-4S binding protein [Bacillota bacterium]